MNLPVVAVVALAILGAFGVFGLWCLIENYCKKNGKMFVQKEIVSNFHEAFQTQVEAFRLGQKYIKAANKRTREQIKKEIGEERYEKYFPLPES